MVRMQVCGRHTSHHTHTTHKEGRTLYHYPHISSRFSFLREREERECGKEKNGLYDVPPPILPSSRQRPSTHRSECCFCLLVCLFARGKEEHEYTLEKHIYKDLNILRDGERERERDHFVDSPQAVIWLVTYSLEQ